MTDTLDKVVIIGGLAVGAYLLWKFSKPLGAASDLVTNAIDIPGAIVQGIASPQAWTQIASNAAVAGSITGASIRAVAENPVGPLAWLSPQNIGKSVVGWLS